MGESKIRIYWKKKLFGSIRGEKKRNEAFVNHVLLTKPAEIERRNSVTEVDNEERPLCHSYDYLCSVIFSHHYLFIAQPSSSLSSSPKPGVHMGISIVSDQTRGTGDS